jgi:hypothetical protein
MEGDKSVNGAERLPKARVECEHLHIRDRSSESDGPDGKKRNAT